MNTLELRQKLSREIEEKMLEYMIQYDPCDRMAVGDVKYFARTASRLAFDAFEKLEASEK